MARWFVEHVMQIVPCTLAQHGAAILDILNEAIVHSTALYDYEPRPPESMGPWFQAKEKGAYPVLGVEDDQGTLLGFGTYGAFRAWPAYKYTVEHSVYVHRDHRGRGIGGLLLSALIDRARKADVHVLVGGIDATNLSSIRLHTSMGFVHAGTIAQAGFKFGRWLDLAFYQLTLDTPEHPVDG